MTLQQIVDRLSQEGGFRWSSSNQEKIRAREPVQAVKLEIARFGGSSREHRVELQLFTHKSFAMTDAPSSLALSVAKGNVAEAEKDAASKAVFGLAFSDLANRFESCRPEVKQYQITCRDSEHFGCFVDTIKCLVAIA